MLRSGARFKFSGRIQRDDFRHLAVADDGNIIAPSYVTVPGGMKVPQYAPTVVGASTNYDPSSDCDGNFMSYKFQPNNNCYNYSCNVATNSFAQPGRMHGYFLPNPFTGADVVKGAVMDGLISLSGRTMADLKDQIAGKSGHVVALLISPNDSTVDWPGDYHWVRCDTLGPPVSWSQKDGGDQVTNFDFAGNPIVDPATSNWTVNQGPMITGSSNDVVVAYSFYTYMFVGAGGVSII
jgi:hypothetical protein